MKSTTSYLTIRVAAVLALIGTLIQPAASQPLPVKQWQKTNIRTFSRTSWGTIAYFAGQDQGNVYLALRGTFVIEQVTTLHGESLIFGPGGAKFLAGVDSISGSATPGDTLSVALSAVKSVGITSITDNGVIRANFSPDMVRKRFSNLAGTPGVVAIPIDSIQSMRAWHSTNSGALFIGLLAGGVIGYAIGTTKEDDPDDWDHLIVRFDKDTKMVFDVALGMLAGATVGYVIGGKRGWRDVEIKKPMLSIAPSYISGPGVTLSVKF